MFEVGKAYRIKIWEADDHGGGATEYYAGKLIEMNFPLVTFKNAAFRGGRETIINTASLAFISAWEDLGS